MDLLFENAVSFRKCVDAISVLVDEAEFDLNEQGLLLKATDPSQIAMVDFRLERSAFKEFKLESDKKIGVDLDFFGSVLSRAKSSDSLKLSLDSGGSKLLVSFLGSSKRVFEVPLIEINSSRLPSPRISFAAEIKLKAESIQDGLKDAALVSTHVTLGVDAERFFLRAHSSKGTVNNEILMGDKKQVLEAKVGQEASAMFPLDYLSYIVKSASSDTNLTVMLGPNMPVQVSYEIDKAKLNYFLAPRIESE